MSIKIYTELLNLIEKQGEMIARLVNENAEQENIINELMRRELFDEDSD